MKHWIQYSSIIILLSVVTVLSACTARIDQRGKTPEKDKLAQVQPGIHTKEDVMRLIGSPTNTGTFNDDIWIYFHKVTETVSFFEPKVIEQDMYIMSFNEVGIVQEIQHTDGQGKIVEPVKRLTLPAGKDTTFLQKIFGNFGRQSKKDKKEKD